MLNRIVLIGRLTRDPEMKYTPQGVPVATMGLAVNRFTKDADGNHEVDFFDIVAWRRTAEFASNYLTKGRLVSVDGRLQSRSYVAQDGTKRKVYEIVADNLEGLERKGETDDTGGSAGEHVETEPAYTAPASARPTPPAANNTAANNTKAASPARKPATVPVDDDLDEADPFADE